MPSAAADLTAATQYLGAYLSSTFACCSVLQSAPCIGTNAHRFASITPIVKESHCLPVKHCSVFKTPSTLLNRFLHSGFFHSIGIFTSSTAVVTTPGTVKILESSLLFLNSNHPFSFAFDAPTLCNALNCKMELTVTP